MVKWEKLGDLTYITEKVTSHKITSFAVVLGITLAAVGGLVRRHVKSKRVKQVNCAITGYEGSDKQIEKWEDLLRLVAEDPATGKLSSTPMFSEKVQFKKTNFLFSRLSPSELTDYSFHNANDETSDATALMYVFPAHEAALAASQFQEVQNMMYELPFVLVAAQSENVQKVVKVQDVYDAFGLDHDSECFIVLLPPSNQSLSVLQVVLDWLRRRHKPQRRFILGL
eukprot:GFYU01011043.1.p1 GENE.GFYU01011043.1~~GFYU01011043.1.p1  ORF type:complete len:251 (+),score=49.32 GFYU01011043.1:76-753(+)